METRIISDSSACGSSCACGLSQSRSGTTPVVGRKEESGPGRTKTLKSENFLAVRAGGDRTGRDGRKSGSSEGSNTNVTGILREHLR